MKMRVERIRKNIEIPQGVTFQVDGNTVKLNGGKGELSRSFKNPKVTIAKEDNRIIIESKNATKKEKMMVGTYTAHIKNMINGVMKSHFYELKICSEHFPMNITIDKNKISVKNFLGEKIPRELKIKNNVTVKMDGDTIKVESIDKELAGQMAGLIEKLTAVTNKDRRVFQDGIYIVNKDGKEMI